MSFSQGFANGLQLGEGYKRNKLDKEMFDQKTRDVADHLKLQQAMLDQGAAQAAEDLKLRQANLALLQSNASESVKKDTLDRIMNDMKEMSSSARLRRTDAVHQNLSDAQADAMRMKATGAGGDFTQTTEEIDPETGAVISMKRNTRTKGGQPQAALPPPRPAPDPSTLAAQQRIDALKKQIGEDQVQIAGGDNRYGLNLFSRQGRIDDSNSELAKLMPLLGAPQEAAPAPQVAPGMAPGQPAAPAAAAPMAPAPRPVVSAVQPVARGPQPAIGTKVSQGGKIYIFNGRGWDAAN